MLTLDLSDAGLFTLREQNEGSSGDVCPGYALDETEPGPEGEK